MRFIFLMFLIVCISSTLTAEGTDSFEQDVFDTNVGKLTVTFIGHGTLMFQVEKMVIHVDPYSRLADYSTLPKADLVLITHEHGDHLDLKALKEIVRGDTTVICTEKCLAKFPGGFAMTNGKNKTVNGILIEAEPAYNVVNKRQNGKPFHPEGEGNGYILNIGDKRIYVAGDTENIPEMEKLENIDVAFLPMNLPYTMTPEMVADAARAFKPKILYPYHYGRTDPQELVDLLKNEPGIEVRIRKMR